MLYEEYAGWESEHRVAEGGFMKCGSSSYPSDDMSGTHIPSLPAGDVEV